MRVLGATTAGDGHFGPMVPFLRACADAGHEVAVAAPESFAATVSAAGFRHHPFADAPPELVGPVMARLPAMSFEEANATVVREVFGRIDAQAALPGVTAVIDTWRPDVVLREPAELASAAAAEKAGVPHVQVAISMLEVTSLFMAEAAEPVAELSRMAGLAEDRLGRSFETEVVMSSVPEGLDLADGPLPDAAADVRRFRDPGLQGTAEPLPASWGDPDAPLVYVTFGSVTGSLPPFTGVFREALAALSDLPARVLMTVGRRIDPGSLRPWPGNAHVEQWCRPASVLPHASGMLGHGGFGTTMGAVAAGVPQVVTPIFTSDQVVNGRHVAASGVGLTVPPGDGVVGRGAALVPKILADATYDGAAGRLAADMAALPHPEESLEVLSALVG